MASYADLALYNHNGQLAAIAVIKNKLGTSREWAAQLRRNLFAHGNFCPIDFFLLVTPDHLYLWKHAGTTAALVPPTYDVEAEPIFAPYFKSASVDPRHASGYAFELVVVAWLSDLIQSEGNWEEHANGQSWLVESGFLTAVRNGRIEYEVIV
jgi:hypothetical protein